MAVDSGPATYKIVLSKERTAKMVGMLRAVAEASPPMSDTRCDALEILQVIDGQITGQIMRHCGIVPHVVKEG